MSAEGQIRAPMLGVASSTRAPDFAPPVWPAVGGGWVIAEGACPDRVIEAHGALILDQMERAARVSSSTELLCPVCRSAVGQHHDDCSGPEQAEIESEVYRQRLVDFGRKRIVGPRGPVAMILAGRLLTELGGDARIAARERLASGWPTLWAKVDEHLDIAGCAAAVQLDMEDR